MPKSIIIRSCFFMRRSICYCEPNTAIAGEVNTWVLTYTTSVNLAKGARLKLDLCTRGRDIDWQIPSANLKKQSNVIYARIENGKPIQGIEIDIPESLSPQFGFVLPAALEAGRSLSFIIGAPPGSNKADLRKKGNRAQCNAQRRRTFLLYVDITGKGRFEEPEVFNIDIRGSTLSSIRVLAPSYVARNKRFDAIVRFEDEFGNLTGNAPEDTLIELSHENIRENLKWRLFIPETGFIALPNLYFNEAGVYTLQLYNTKTKKTFRSPPIKCFNENSRHLFWGLLHGESERVDSTENIEGCLRHFRDDKSLNYYATSHFEGQEETPNEIWKLATQSVAEFDETDRFSTFLGFQWVGEPNEEGVRQILYFKDNKPLLRKKDPKNSTLKKIYKGHSPKEIISIPSFTMAKGLSYDFKNYDPEFERVVEIYNAWGSSEFSKKDGNTRPIFNKDKKGVQENGEGAIQKALLANCRFGFVAGGLDDRGIYSEFYEGDQEQYTPGLTAIIAPEHSRTAIAEALYNRSCYATTGERMLVGLYVAGAPMGSEISSATKHGLFINRHLNGYVAGTTDLKTVEIIRNGKVLKTFKPEGYSLQFEYDDMTPLEKVVLRSPDKRPPFVYYYLRVTQADGHIAWSSPIWVDMLPPVKKPIVKRPEVAASAKKVKPVIEEEEEDEDFDDDDDDV